MWNYRVATVWDIPIRVNVSLLVFLPVLAWLIGSGTQIAAYANLVTLTSGVPIDVAVLTDGTTPWLVGAAAAVMLFVSVTAHELGHAYAAMRYDIEVESITLWILGGLASMKTFPKEWQREFWIAVAGPIVSVALGVVCIVALPAFSGGGHVVVFVVGWLGVTNLLLAVFNMLPAFPMDGGRVLRALLARRRPYAEATRIAARIGTGFAILFAVVGALTFSPMLLLLALFVYGAASGESRIAVLDALLDGVVVGDLVDRTRPRVDADDSLAALTDAMVAARETTLLVTDGDAVVGVVTLDHLKRADGDADGRVRDVASMDLPTVASDTPAFEALVTMQSARATAALVDDGAGPEVALSNTDFDAFFEFRQVSGSLGDRVPM